MRKRFCTTRLRRKTVGGEDSLFYLPAPRPNGCRSIVANMQYGLSGRFVARKDPRSNSRRMAVTRPDRRITCDTIIESGKNTGFFHFRSLCVYPRPYFISLFFLTIFTALCYIPILNEHSFMLEGRGASGDRGPLTRQPPGRVGGGRKETVH